MTEHANPVEQPTQPKQPEPVLQETPHADSLRPEDFLRAGYQQIQRAKRQILSLFIVGSVLLLAAVGGIYYAQVSKPAADLGKIRGEVSSLTKRLDSLEAKMKDAPTPAPTVGTKTTPKATMNAENLGAQSPNSGVNNSTLVLVADSVADFSGIQGQNGWYYGYYKNPHTNPTFTLFDKSEFKGASWSREWAGIQSGAMHPNGPHPEAGFEDERFKGWKREYLFTTLRWISSIEGNSAILITLGYLEENKRSPHHYDSVLMKMTVDGKLVFYKDVYSIPNASGTFRIDIPVKQGTVVEFIIDPLQTCSRDHVLFSSSIYTTKE